MRVRKGFTLVEMLIVIVVIGVLSSMMMISSTESINSAKASDIITSLNNIKVAALAHYVDSFDTYNRTPTQALDIANIKPYLNNGSSLTSEYGVESNNKLWFAKCDLTKLGNNSQIKSKLAGRANSAGLKSAASPTAANYTDENTVYLRIR